MVGAIAALALLAASADSFVTNHPSLLAKSAATRAHDAAEATSEPATTTTTTTTQTIMDGADHLGDVGGSHLAVDLSLSSAFTPLQRIVLTANGNLQRILSAYHNRAVTVTVLRNERVKIGLWRRRVLIAVDGTPACVAASVVTAVTREAIELADGGGVGIGQIFAELGGKQSFSLLEVSKNATTFSRTYTLANAHIMCHVEEVLPLNLFDDDFFARAPDWHPDAALQ